MSDEVLGISKPSAVPVASAQEAEQILKLRRKIANLRLKVFTAKACVHNVRAAYGNTDIDDWTSFIDESSSGTEGGPADEPEDYEYEPSETTAALGDVWERASVLIKSGKMSVGDLKHFLDECEEK